MPFALSFIGANNTQESAHRGKSVFAISSSITLLALWNELVLAPLQKTIMSAPFIDNSASGLNKKSRLKKLRRLFLCSQNTYCLTGSL